MSIAHQSVSDVADGLGTSITTEAPSGVVSGDLLHLWIFLDVADTITTPTGWSFVNGIESPSGGVEAACYRRTADGSADDTPTVTIGTSQQFGAVIVRDDGQDPTTPVDTSATDSSDSDLTPAIPGLTTANDDELLYGAIVSGTFGFTADPVGWTLTQSFPTSPIFRLYRKTAPTAGSYGGEGTMLALASPTAQLNVAFNSVLSPPSGLDLQGATCGV